MNKWFFLVFSFMFAMPLQAYCDTSTIVGRGDVIVAQTTPVLPQTGTVRSPAPPSPPVAVSPQDHALFAAREMIDAANQASFQCQRYQREYAKIMSNPIMQHPSVRSAMNTLGGMSCYNQNHRQATEHLYKAVKGALSQGTSQTQGGAQSQGTLQKGGPATLPKGGPAK